MLAVGLIAIAIGGTVFFFVVNKLQDIEKKKKEDEDWDRRFR